MNTLKAALRLGSRQLSSGTTLSQNSRYPKLLSTMHPTNRYAMPGESAEHAFTVMIFPSRASMDDDEYTTGSQAEIANIANAISEYEPVHLYTRPELVSKAKSMVKSNVIVKPGAVDQLWVRDSGPVFVKDTTTQQVTAMNFNFNYWGSKLRSTGDEQVAQIVAETEGIPQVKAGLCMEGGAIEHDGEGTFLGAESCIINKNRNPGMTKSDIENELTATLGVTKFIWVPGVKGKDITDWHIDALARFTEPGVVMLSKPAPGSPKYAIKVYEQTREILLQSKDAKGRSLTIHDCEEPDLEKIGIADDANEVVGSYANYLLVNGAVIMAKFGQAEIDKKAYNLFERLFPSRKVVQVDLNFLPRTGGGIHCATQQVPL